MLKQISNLFYLVSIFCVSYWTYTGDSLSIRNQIFLFMLSVFFLCLGSAVRLFTLDKQRHKALLMKTIWIVCIFYLITIIRMLFFGNIFHVVRGSSQMVNLTPFKTIKNYFEFYKRTGSYISFANLFGNIILLFPLGVFLPILLKQMRHFYVFIPVSLLIATMIEVIQWKTSTGVADIDDTILNFIGAMAGFVTIRIIQIIYFHIRRAKQ